jgi:hypothetical protein
VTAGQAATLRRALRGQRGLLADVQLTATAAVGDPTETTERLKVTT